MPLRNAGPVGAPARWMRGLAALAASVVLAAVASAAAAPAAASVPAPPSAAGVQDFVFESLDVDYTLALADDGTSRLSVVETFVAVFPEFDQNRGMQRRIPDAYNGVPTFPTLQSVTDGEGNPRPEETETEDGHLIVTSRSDDFVHGRQIYVFTYTMQNVAGAFVDTEADEFYWDVNGVDWAQPFGRVSARVSMQAELAGALTGEEACYRGSQGSTATCEITRDAGAAGSAVLSASATDLGPFETMTVAVGFESGTFTPFDSSYLASPWGWLQALAALLVAGSIALAAVAQRRHLRDEPGRPTIITEFTPPPEIDALESAVLLGKTTKAIPAEVLEQAVAGSIHIVEGPPKVFGGTKLEAQLVDPSRADGDGRMLLDGLFGPGAPAGSVYEFGRADTRFSSAAQKILKAASTELRTRGLRRPVPPMVPATPILAAIGAGTLVFVLGFAAISAGVFPLGPIAVMAAAIVGFFVVVGLVTRTPLTAKGAETRDHLKGLQVFIEWAEADRIRMLQSPQGAERQRIDTNDPRQMLKLYEVLLPYAVVFGQEKEWAEQLAVLYGADGSPGWYTGSSGFHAAAFASGIGSLSSSTSASSSTSGGSSGGGSAGGGGGGGGGGGV